MAEVLKDVQKKNRRYLYKIVGRIIAIDMRKPFYYIACKRCMSKVVDGYCLKCNGYEDSEAAYNFSMKVSDGTESLWIQIFAERGEQLLGITAEEMKSVEDHKMKFNSLKYKVMSKIVK